MPDHSTTSPDSGPPPETGDPEIDQALHDLDSLAAEPLPDHHDRLARAHEVLQGSLDRTDRTEPS